MKNLTRTVLVGIGATLAIDSSTALLSLFGTKSHGLLFVGRWLAYIPKGKFFHHTIIQTPSVANELIIGWIAHYCIGIAFAFLLVLMYGKKWLLKPRLFPAIVIGIITLIAPIFILQPVLGFGIAFSNMPKPGFLMLKILRIHIVYGAGLYLSAKVMHSVSNAILQTTRDH